MATVDRCEWANGHDLLTVYHDTEWGVPQHDDRILFEYLLLDGAQAGLSWLTILRKREAYRAAFSGWDAQSVAAYTDADVERLLADAGIVRNRAKIIAAIDGARAFLRVQEEFGSFDAYIWRFVNGKPVVNTYESWDHIPAETEESRAMSKDLKARGFRFVGPTICYAFMQGAGLVNDHTITCFRHGELRQEPARIHTDFS